MGKKHEELIRKIFFEMTMEKLKSLQEKGHGGESLEVEFRHFFEEILYIAYEDLGLKKFADMPSEDDDSSSDDEYPENAVLPEEEPEVPEDSLKIGTLWLSHEEAVQMITEGVPIPFDTEWEEENMMKHLLHHLNGFLNKRYFASRLNYSEDVALVTYDDHQICTIHIHDGYIQMMDAPNIDPTTVTAQVFPAIVTFLYPEGKESEDKKMNKIDKSSGKVNKDAKDILNRFKKRYPNFDKL